jgi:acyl carrier protein
MTIDEQSVNRTDVFERVKKVLISMLKIFREKKAESRPMLSMETHLIDDLGVDSLETLDIMNALEDEFQVSPNLNEVNSKRKLGQIVDYVIELQNKKSIKRS